MVLLFIAILAITYGIASGLRSLLPSEYYSAVFWILQILYATALGMYCGINTFKDRWSKKRFSSVFFSFIAGFIFVPPAWLGIGFGFGVDVTLSRSRSANSLIEGVEGLAPAVGSFYTVAFLIGCLIGWITTRIPRR